MSEFITNGELRMEAERLCDENERLETENAKLRLQIHWLKKGDVYAYEAGYHDGLGENAKLRELIIGAYEAMDAWQMVIANGSDTWGYGKGCLEQLRKLRDDMHELGIEVDE